MPYARLQQYGTTLLLHKPAISAAAANTAAVVRRGRAANSSGSANAVVLVVDAQKNVEQLVTKVWRESQSWNTA